MQLSLFTDRRATPEQLSAGDEYGSLLWRLAREKQTPEVLEGARQYAPALAWPREDRAAKFVPVRTEFCRAGRMNLQAVI